MTSTENNTFAGRPITGEISHYGANPVEQKPIEEFLTAMDAVFAFPEVQAIRWTQYTPYFNDGDACEFSAHQPGFRIDGISEDAGDHEDGFINAWDIEWGNEVGPKKYNEEVRYPQISADLTAAIKVFSEAVEGGAHQVDLKKHFGDPAEVTATRAGFDVEYYDHD